MRVHYTYSIDVPDDRLEAFLKADCIIGGIRGLDLRARNQAAMLATATLNGVRDSYNKQFRVGLVGQPSPEARAVILQHMNLIGLVLSGETSVVSRHVGASIVDNPGVVNAVQRLLDMLDAAASVIANVDGGEMVSCQTEEWVAAANDVLADHAKLRADMNESLEKSKEVKP